MKQCILTFAVKFGDNRNDVWDLLRYLRQYEETNNTEITLMEWKDEEPKFVDGKYYYNKGYYWKGKFIQNNNDEETYELGYYHGSRIAERLNRKDLKKILRNKPANRYEEGKNRCDQTGYKGG